MPEEDLLSPDGRLAARRYVWRTSHDPWDQDIYWRVEVLNPRTKLVLLTRSCTRGISHRSRHETGADVAAFDFSPDSRRTLVRLSDGTTEDLDLSALVIDPPFDETLHYRLDRTPWPPSGVRIRIVERIHGHPHRDLELPPVAERPPVRPPPAVRGSAAEPGGPRGRGSPAGSFSRSLNHGSDTGTGGFPNDSPRTGAPGGVHK